MQKWGERGIIPRSGSQASLPSTCFAIRSWGSL